MNLDKKCDEGVEIKSPVVGTFYDAATSSWHSKDNKKYENYNSNPYVEIGSKVTPKTLVCDVVAMSVVIPVEAGIYGTIEEKLVKSGDGVEYNQTLFKITPDNKNNSK